MPFPYVYVCDLLDKLERLFRRQVPLLHRDLNGRVNSDVTEWFKRHRSRLDAFDTNAEAVMSILRPEQITDRVYGIDAKALELIIARALRLSRPQYLDLQQWKKSQVIDLADCVQRVMQKMKGSATRAQADKVMVEEIDQVLFQIAASNPNSSAEVQNLAKTSEISSEVEAIGSFYQRLQSKEAKWLTRLILKNYAPVTFPNELQMASGQSYLPRCISISLQIPSSAPSAVRKIGTGIIRGIPSLKPAQLPTPPTSSPSCPPAQISTVSANIDPASSMPLYSTQKAHEGLDMSQKEVLLNWSLNHLPFSQRVGFEAGSCQATTCVVTVRGERAAQNASTTYQPGAQRNSSQVALRSSPRRSMTSQDILTSSSRFVLGSISGNVPRGSQHNSQLRTTNPEAVTPPLRIAGYGICRLTGDTCKFTRCLFLVSPCISRVPWVIDDLLPRHGARVLTSLPALNHPSLPRHCPQTGRRYRKIALVESNRVEQSATFMKQISKLELKRKGKKEWVEVYDWRLLECFTKVEQGKPADYDPWKRCWVGAV